MQPAVTTTGKLAQLRYDLAHRVHDAKVYPVKAPNGSTVLVYGHDGGVGILWRGGRPLKKSTAAPPKQPPKPPAKVNGTSNNAIMIIDSDSDDATSAKAPPKPAPAEFQDEDEELDPAQPYPSIVQHLRLALNTHVLHVAVPDVPTVSALRPAETVPSIFSSKLVFAVACADYSVRVITLPLHPPSDVAKSAPWSKTSQCGEEVLRIPTHLGHQAVPRGVAMTWTSRAEPSLGAASDDDMDVDGAEEPAAPGRRQSPRKQSRSRSRKRGGADGWDLLVASHSAEVGGLLKLWRLELSETSVTAKSPFLPYQTVALKAPAARIAFSPAQYPKRRHSQLLIADCAGVARIYDPFVVPSRKRRAGADPELGSYVALFRTTFQTPSSNVPMAPALASRKPIIDAAWATDGHSIVALLADGEWGVWDVDRSGPKPPPDPSSFSIRGYVGSSESTRSSNGPASPKRSSRGGLAPMTPNTRRHKEEALFSGTSGSALPARGGVAVDSLVPTDGGLPEDSVVIWYGSDLYRIPDLSQYWTRAASGTSSLSRSSLSSIQGLGFSGETISSISQFDTTVKDARMGKRRDILISTEHRLLISTNAERPLEDGSPSGDNDQDQDQEMRITDQALLERGELDLGGMDRLLEDLEGSGGLQQSLALGNPRKVLFASSTN